MTPENCPLRGLFIGQTGDGLASMSPSAPSWHPTADIPKQFELIARSQWRGYLMAGKERAI